MTALTAPLRIEPAQPRAPVAIHLDGVGRAFPAGRNHFVAIEAVSLDVSQGQVVCMVGASGSGQSTLLSIAAGLDRPTVGTVEVQGRRPALMFQDASLLPWLNVEQNVALPMRLAGRGRAERSRTVADLLGLVRLEEAAAKRPHELSGGMRQRVALARALAQRADVLLMDEPFGALDAITRDLLHEDLLRIQDETGITILLVTHDVREAVRLAHRVVLLGSRPGRIVAEWEVKLPADRRTDGAGVGPLVAAIKTRLRQEIAGHVGDPPEDR
ncbi:MAG: ABC transporter ATP-binding protein [Candidatus Dormibacteria bacterium]